MGSPSLGDDLGIERLGVVRAHQPEAGRVGERDVQQRFVPVALGHLRRSPLGVDRLADAADPHV
jgi:hypothetical protein